MPRRRLAQLKLAAALHHPRPSNPEQAPGVAALAAEALTTMSQAPVVSRAWVQARERWHAQALRRWVMPGHARVALIGGGLNPTPLGLPPGLIGQGALAIVDRPEVLKHRRDALEAIGLREPATIGLIPADPLEPEAWLPSLEKLEGGAELPLIVLWQGSACYAGFSALQVVMTGLSQHAASGSGVRFGFDWLAPASRSLPASLRDPLMSFGDPLPIDVLGVALALKACGARDVRDVPLLVHDDLCVGVATEAIF